MPTTYREAPATPPPLDPIPAYHGISTIGAGGAREGTGQGPFTAAQYARWAGLSLRVAQAVLDKAVSDGILTAS